jgi:hypothetical protein
MGSDATERMEVSEKDRAPRTRVMLVEDQVGFKRMMVACA